MSAAQPAFPDSPRNIGQHRRHAKDLLVLLAGAPRYPGVYVSLEEAKPAALTAADPESRQTFRVYQMIDPSP